MIVAAGLVVPLLITYNKGFAQSNHVPCGVRDLVLDFMAPASDYLRHNIFALNVVIALSSLLMDI
jgi:hypothetical protein